MSRLVNEYLAKTITISEDDRDVLQHVAEWFDKYTGGSLDYTTLYARYKGRAITFQYRPAILPWAPSPIMETPWPLAVSGS